MITTIDMRLFLDRNPNALAAVPVFNAGERIERGLYWDPARRRVERIEAATSAPTLLARIHPNPDATFEDLVHHLALGGGGYTGDPLEVVARR